MGKSIAKIIYFIIFIIAFLFIDYQFISDTEWIHDGELIFAFIALNIMLFVFIYAIVYEIKEIIKIKNKTVKNKEESKTALLFFGLVAIIIAIIFVIFMAVK